MEDKDKNFLNFSIDEKLSESNLAEDENHIALMIYFVKVGEVINLTVDLQEKVILWRIDGKFMLKRPLA